MKAAFALTGVLMLSACATTPPPAPALAPPPAQGVTGNAVLAGLPKDQAAPIIADYIRNCLANDPELVDLGYYKEGDAHVFHDANNEKLRVTVSALTPRAGMAKIEGPLATKAFEERIADAAFGRPDC